MKPIFVFSLPRSGSTMLQRVLMTHPCVCSASEPWLLLPLLHINRPESQLAEYSHMHAVAFINEFIHNMPGGKEIFYKELRTFVLKLYQNYCQNGEDFFVDKTPRYYFIIPEIARLFPDAKFIFIARAPQRIFASIIKTFCANDFGRLYGYDVDLKKGPRCLYEGFRELASRSLLIRYEDLVTSPDDCLKRVSSYLELRYDNSILSEYRNQKLAASAGDPKTYQFDHIDPRGLNEWKKTFSTKARRMILLDYLNSSYAKPFYKMGYNKSEILDAVKGLPPANGNGLPDVVGLIKSQTVIKLKLNQFLAPGLRWNKWFAN
jgi:hypothetical protein